MTKREKESSVSSKTDKKKKNQECECDVFDLKRIELLVGLMKENDLTEIELQRDNLKIQLKRKGAEMVSGIVPAAVAALPSAPAAVPAPAAAKAAPEKAAESDESFLKVITSPMVGTFYASPSPDAAPFVAVGDVVGPEKTVCIIEAMKVFNEIQAEIAGKIVAVLAKDGDAVEFGKPLFKVDPRL